jgi:WD40 repeat protein
MIFGNSTTSIFDPVSGKLLRELPKIMSQGLKFDPTGRTLAVSYVDAGLALWNAETGELLRSMQTRGNELYAVDWSPAGDVLATSGLGAAITLWDPRDLSILKELDAPEWVIQVRFSPDGTRLLTSGGSATPPKDQRVVVWGVGEAEPR